MIKIINDWFKCDKCPREGDQYYELQHKGKKIKVCEDCLRKIKKGGKHGKTESLATNAQRS